MSGYMTLGELQQRRLKWVEASRENGFEDGIKRLLKDLYPDNAHFIYELLQNSEDAQATRVRFTLKDGCLEFAHDGSRLFSLKDVENITNIGNSEKKDDHTSIGKFGVGFKAVFAYTMTPEVASGSFHFRIRDLVVPDTTELTPLVPSEQETRFLFPFDNPQKPPERAHQEIEKGLRELDANILLFLSNIRRIEYQLPDSPLGFLERPKADGNRVEIRVRHPEDSELTSDFFLHFDKEVNVTDENGNPNDYRIAVAFGLEKTQGTTLTKSRKKRRRRRDVQWKIKPLSPGRVSIYFPAEKEGSNLRFHLHAPFASTVARDSVRDCPENDRFRDHLAELVVESMAAIRDQGLLNVGFLATLPNRKDDLLTFYEPILQGLIEAFKSQRLVPMKQGNHKAAADVFRGPRELTDLVKDQDLVAILGDRYEEPMWIANPSQRNQREDDFLSDLGITQWRTEQLLDTLSTRCDATTSWLKSKPDEWFQDLYLLLDGFLSTTSSTHRTEQLKKLPIVRCTDRIDRPGNESYFQEDDTDDNENFPRVAKGVYPSVKQKRDRVSKFLEEIGVRRVREVEQVEMLLQRRYSSASFDPCVGDMRRFIDLVERDREQARLFADYSIFKLEDGDWRKSQHVFLDAPYLDTGLRIYYEAIGESDRPRWEISSEYQDSGIEAKDLGKFAAAVGAQTGLKPQKQDIPSGHPQKGSLRDSGGWSDKYGIDQDYDVPEFEVLLRESNLDKSKLIWRSMTEVAVAHLQARYRSNSLKPTLPGDSSLVHRLRRVAWVPQKTSYGSTYDFRKPCDAVAGLLPEGFCYQPGSAWLKAIEFGRNEVERRKREQTTQDYQRRSEAAKCLGFPNAEVAQRFSQMWEKDPEVMERVEAERRKPEFPERPSQDPKRRGERTAQQHAESREKEYERRERSVRVSRGESDPKTWLREQYTNRHGQMICQICQKEMPFKKRDGEYYFEAVEALSDKYFSREHESQFVALCPLCAAMYEEFIKREKSSMSELHEALTVSDGLEIPLELGERRARLRFVETHMVDMRAVLRKRGTP